ncbi:hypothetical protein E4U53_003217, partial [Claviceps sorghi]
MPWPRSAGWAAAAAATLLSAVANADYFVEPSSVPISTRSKAILLDHLVYLVEACTRTHAKLEHNRNLVYTREEHVPAHLPADGAPNDLDQHVRS